MELQSSDSESVRPSEKQHFFNSFFFKKLTEKSGGNEAAPRSRVNHERVRKWTKVLHSRMSKADSS